MFLMTCVALMVVDGDTVKCDGQNLRLMGDGAPYVSGFDTPEMPRYADCPAEAHKGLRAAARMIDFVETPGLQIEDSGEKDSSGRPLVVFRLPDGSTVGSHMIEEGLARVWTPGSKANWCS